MIYGILTWGSVVITNLSLIVVFQIWRKSRKVKIIDILTIILIVDSLVHVLIAVTSSYNEMMMWKMISFPFVALVNIFICLIGKLLFESLARRHPFFNNEARRNP